MEATHLAVDIQLRILQCLPTLMQNYNLYIKGDLLIKLLGICSSLTTNNKSTVVINTASATLQQLFSNIYDKIKELDSSNEEENRNEVRIDNDEVIVVNDLSLEGFNIFKDLCHLIENEKPTYFNDTIHIKSLSVLEIIENIITSHKKLFSNHQELAFLLRVKIIPSLLRILNSSNKNFPLVTRTMRIIHVLLASQLDNLEIESEIVLSFLNHILLNNESVNELPEKLDWEKVLVLEMFKSLFSDFAIIKSIFEKYDNNPAKKNVIQELMSILSTYLSYNSYLINDTIQISQTSITYSSQSQASVTPIYLSRQLSNMKIPILDHLDKVEAPTSIPATYPIYLIFNVLLAYADGIAKFVNNLSNESDPDTLEADVEFINSFIEVSHPDASLLFEKFIYSSMDNECFHVLIRSLQKFTHATGLLDLSSLRDDLLLILSRALIKNESAKDLRPPNPNGVSSLQEQGKQLLALGESLVESFNSTLQNHSNDATSQQQSQSQSQSYEPVLKSRNFNSRHVTCLRALINLAVSLGSTLQKSWSIIWITLQWCDYYIEGPDEYGVYLSNKSLKGFSDDMLPKLSNQDLNNIEISKKKFLESINEYPVDSFHELLSVLTELSDSSFNCEGAHIRDDNNNALKVCPYNKTFYLSKFLNICQINLTKFLIENDKSWELISGYFNKLGTNRSFQYNLRIHIINTFNNIIKNMAVDGFASNSKEINSKTSKKSLQGLVTFLDEQFNLGLPNELLVLNCETEVHLLVLTTLHELIDKYDTYYQDSWYVVFKILNTPFRTTGTDKDDNNLREKVRLLIDTSFDSLKLILDEFLSSLPFNQLKLLIDTLFNFCSQSYDLNISFSSVSYFWLIGDSLRSRIISSEEEVKELSVETEGDLISFLENNQKDSKLFYTLLDIYLLLTLVKLSNDPRAQVRDGSVQTFFQIIDVHGNLLLPSWDIIYGIVLPILLNLKLDLNNSNFIKKDCIESLNLIISGLVSIYNKYLMNFDTDIYAKWEGLINYFKRLLMVSWIDLNLKLFKAFRDLLIPFDKLKINKNDAKLIKIRGLLFSFWVEIPIEYDFVNSLYQESIATLMDCYPPLYHLISPNLTIEEINTVLTLLNRCARYPILPDNQLDNLKPSKLQSSVINNLKIMDINDSVMQSQVIQQLSTIAIYPFGIRSRIEQKLNNKLNSKFKIPTFIAVSHLSVNLLREKLENFKDLRILIQDKGINKILKSLLEIIESKSIGIEKESKLLWIEANEILKFIISKLIDDNSSDHINIELWKLILSSVKICFDNNDLKYESINIRQYNDLSAIVLPSLLVNPEDNESLINDFISNVYKNSFLYEYDDLEHSIIEECQDSINSLIDALSSFNFNSSFGSTKPISIYPNKKTRIKCLKELIKFSQLPQHALLNDIALNYLISRISFCLRRFICDQSLLYKCPIPKIQQEELDIILNGLVLIHQSNPISDLNLKNLNKLHSLLIKLIPFACRIKGLKELLQTILIRF